MQEKGLGTPATRAAIIEGLIYEKYIHREGRELVPGAKAFQLMTLLRGLGVEDLTKPELTGNWEYQLAEMEKGHLERSTFMKQIAEMAERIVKKAKEYDRDTIPGDYATLAVPCPNCGGVVKENYRRYACIGVPGERERLRLLDEQDPRRARVRARRGRGVPARQADRPARGLPLEGRLAVHRRAQARPRRRDRQLEARVRLRRGRPARRRVGRAGRLRRAGEPRQVPEDAGQRLRVRHQLRVRALGRAGAVVRLQERQGDPAAAGRARADDQAAHHRRDRPARRLRLQQDEAQVQGAAGLGCEGEQGRVRVRAAARAKVGGEEGRRGRQAGGRAKPAAAAKAKPAAARRPSTQRRPSTPRRPRRRRRAR